MSAEEPDDPLRALAELPCAEPDATRSRAILAAATRTIAARRGVADRQAVVLAGAFARGVVPVAAAALSAAFIASAVVQAILVLSHAGAGVFVAR